MSRFFDFAGKLHLAFTGGGIERVSEKRHDAAWCDALTADRETRLYVVADERIVLKKAGSLADPLFTLEEAEALGAARERVLLGLDHGAGRLAAAIDASAADDAKSRGFLLVDLRSIAMQGLVLAAHLPALAGAKALLLWHTRHRFCSVCGAPTQSTAGGWRRDCPACAAQHFPRTDPVVIMLATADEHCLLGRQPRFAPGLWSCLAGFVEPGENIEEAVRRETEEEAGIKCGRVRYLGSQPWPFPMSLMIACQVEALSTVLTVDRSELEDLRWFARAEVAAMLARCHPDGLTTPPPWAIAHNVIRAWVEGSDGSG